MSHPLFLQAPATADHVADLRRSLRRWLSDALGHDPDAVEDLVLATSEALENAADHAFVGMPTAGTMTLSARLDAAPAGVVIVVEDDGRWQPPAADPGHRGRGLAMIADLAAHHAVDTGAGGTAVTLRHPC